MQISLIEFSVENFKIFKNKAVFSTIARKNNHTFECNGENLLKNTLIYGPNASGKSTLLMALTVMKNMIKKSATNEAGEDLPYYNFLLSDEKTKLPVVYEVVFSLDKRIYKYNFSVLKNLIAEENLSRILPSGAETKYFKRKGKDIILYGEFKKSEDVKEKTRDNVLFLSATAQWNNKLAIKLIEGFKKINVIQGYNSDGYSNFTMQLFQKNSEAKEKILKFLKIADFCISDGKVEEIEVPEQIISKFKKLNNNQEDLPNKIKTMSFSHEKFNINNEQTGYVNINMSDESTGTHRFFDILGPIIDTLDKGKVLFIDEFDNSMHPLLTKLILDIFENSNPNNAQLIVTTHDTSLLSYKDDFDKSQFWFTEKDRFGAAKLFSLAEYKTTRNDTEYFKKYLEGRFGALPFIDTLDK